MLGGSPGGLAPPNPHLAIMMGRSVPAEPSFLNMTQSWHLFASQPINRGGASFGGIHKDICGVELGQNHARPAHIGCAFNQNGVIRNGFLPNPRRAKSVLGAEPLFQPGKGQFMRQLPRAMLLAKPA